MTNRTIKKPGAQKITKTKTKTKTKQNILKTHKSKKSYPSTTRSRGTTPAVITLEILNEIISRELPKIKELEIDAMTAKITGIKTTELGQTQQKDKPTREYIKNLVSALLTTYSTQTNNLRSKKIPEFVPPNGDYKDDVCITSKYNLKKLETSGRGVARYINSNPGIKP